MLDAKNGVRRMFLLVTAAANSRWRRCPALIDTGACRGQFCMDEAVGIVEGVSWLERRHGPAQVQGWVRARQIKPFGYLNDLSATGSMSWRIFNA